MSERGEADFVLSEADIAYLEGLADPVAAKRKAKKENEAPSGLEKTLTVLGAASSVDFSNINTGDTSARNPISLSTVGERPNAFPKAGESAGPANNVDGTAANKDSLSEGVLNAAGISTSVNPSNGVKIIDPTNLILAVMDSGIEKDTGDKVLDAVVMAVFGPAGRIFKSFADRIFGGPGKQWHDVPPQTRKEKINDAMKSFGRIGGNASPVGEGNDFSADIQGLQYQEYLSEAVENGDTDLVNIILEGAPTSELKAQGTETARLAGISTQPSVNTPSLANIAENNPDAPDGNAPADAQRDAKIRADVQAVLDNEQLGEQAKIAAIEKVSSDNGITSTDVLSGIIGGVLTNAVIGVINNVNANANTDGTTTTDGNTTTTENETAGTGGENMSDDKKVFGLTTAQIISGFGSVLNGYLGNKAAKGAADAQTDASDAALAVFEKNAAASVARLRETTSAATDIIQTGAEASRNDITAARDIARNDITQGSNAARDAVTTARDNSMNTLLKSYGIQAEEITATALASSGLISAAREKAAGAITSGFSAAISQIGTSRDIANKILQDSLATAEEKMDVGRAGAIAAQDRGVEAVRSDFQPYLDAGKMTLDNVTSLVNDPQAQKDFITNNPFFDALAKKSEDALLRSKASVGKVGTGGTQVELQNEMLAIGNQLLDAAINRSLPLIQGGQNAAAQVAAAERARASAVSQIELSVGQSLAQLTQSTGVNRANVEQNAGNAIADLNVGQGKELAAVESQAGRDLASIESTRGAQITSATANTGAQLADTELTSGANLANIATSTGTALADSANQAGANLANINTGSTDAQAKLVANQGVNEANILTGNAANTAETLIGQGNAKAAGIVGGTNAITGGLLNLGTIALNPTKFGTKINENGVAA